MKEYVGKKVNIMMDGVTGFRAINSGTVESIVEKTAKKFKMVLTNGKTETFGYQSDAPVSKILYGERIVVVTYRDGSQTFLDFF